MLDSASVNSISSIPSPVYQWRKAFLLNMAENFLDGGRVSDKGGGHLETSRWDVADAGHHVVRDPLHEVGGVLVLHVEHLLIHLLHGHPAPEAGGHGEVPAMSRVAGGHHVLGVEHLLGELGHGDCSVLLGPAGG